MSGNLISINGKPNSLNQKEFVVDTEDDILLLPRYEVKGKIAIDSGDITTNDPCAIGSTAIVCQTSSVYILAPNNEWTKI